MINSDHIISARKNLQKASQDLGFVIVSPYYIFLNGIIKEVFAFLPEYGTSKGTILELTCSHRSFVERSVSKMKCTVLARVCDPCP